MKSRTSGAPQKSGGKKVSPPPKHLTTELASILVFAVAIFSIIGLVTFHPGDPSLFSSGSRGVAVLNACGKMGAYVSSFLLECFGLGAFLLPAALVFMAAEIFKREGRIRFIGTLGGMTVCVMSLTVFLTLQWKYWPYAGTLVLTGGAFGAWTSELLLREFNSLGSSIVSLLLFCVALVLSTPVSVAKFGHEVSRAAWTSLRFVSQWTWRIARMSVAYLGYVLTLIAMRLFHAVGDGLQKSIEVAARKAKEGRAERERLQAAAALAPAKSIVRSQPEISVAGELSAESANVLPELETEAQNRSSAEFGAAPFDVAEALAPSLYGEPIHGDGPEILAPDHSTASGASLAGPHKNASQLAKLVKNVKTAVRKRGQWKLPTLEFLKRPPKIETSIDKDRLYQNSKILEQKLHDFDIDGQVTAVRPGPVITLYEFKPGPGVKVSRIQNVADDLSMALSAQSVRILAPIPGKSVVGIEVPSDVRETVYLREFLQHPDFHGDRLAIPVIMGKDIGGAPILSDLARMPHLLCAGQTGSGKSVFMNGLICSLLYRFTPDELRLILIDPKFIEFRAYADIPHLLLPVVDDPVHASTALKWAVREMERRYRLLAMLGARNLAGFNQKIDSMGVDVVRDLLLSEENQAEQPAQVTGGDWLEAFEADENGAPRIAKLPYIVIIIDELADLMMTARKDVELSINRIAQKARAAGIHLVIATQRPSTDVVTGLIKANLPSRVSFQLASYVDSKTILDRQGAERLLGQGDMLFIPPGISQTTRLHGAYVDDEEIAKITAFLCDQGEPVYRNEILVEDQESGVEEDEDGDELFDQAIQLIKTSGHASASFLQRHLGVGYNRAAKMIEAMESKGLVGPANGSKPREVLVR